MNKEKLDSLLESGTITQEEYEDLLEKYGLKETEPKKEPEPKTDDEDLDEKLEKLIQAKVDKITSKLGKEKAELQKKYDKLKKDKLSDDEAKELELSDKEKEIADRERALLDKENRLYAIKAIKAAGLDDGSDKSLELVDFVLNDDTDVIDSRVKSFANLVKKFVQSEVQKKFIDSGRDPQGGGKSKTADNPYAKETFNLTEQMRLEAEEPEKAKALKAAAEGK